MPILYIDVPELRQEESSDPIVRKLQEIQWEPWLAYRFLDRDSGGYRQAVHALAVELVRRSAIVESVDVAAAVTTAEESSDAEESGTLDRIAALEEAMPRWTETLGAITAEIERIGELMVAGTAQMNVGEESGKGFAARLTVARRLASDLDAPVGTIESLGQSFAADLAEIDSGVRTLLGEIELQPSDMDVETREQVVEFRANLRTLSESSHEGLGGVQSMIAAVEPIERMSKDMRTPLRRLRKSLTAMAEARQVTDSWLELAGPDLDAS